MAFKLTSAEMKKKDDLSQKVQNALDDLEGTMKDYNGALEALRDFRDSIVSRIQDELSNKSDEWKESHEEEVAVAEELSSTWEQADFEEHDFEEDSLTGSDAVDELPTGE